MASEPEHDAGQGDDETDVLSDLTPEAAAHYPRNFRAMALYTSFMQMGWIFKTESTVIPMFVTYLTTNPMLISVVPVLSRLPQFLSQFLFLGVVERARQRKRVLIAATTLFTFAWGGIAAALWFGGGLSPGVMLALFLTLYAVGWTAMGVERVSNRVMQGSLIPTRRRGRVFGIGGSIGRFSALISGAVIADFMSRDTDFRLNFALLFGMAFAFFVVTVLCQLTFREPPQPPAVSGHMRLGQVARDGWRLLHEDVDFRRIFLIGCFQSFSVNLFAFYVPYARTWSTAPDHLQRLGFALGQGLTIQHVVVGVLSLGLGLLVDWKGNRVVLRGLCLLLANIPLLIILIGRYVPADARLTALLGVYAMIGCLPVMARVTGNYVLEIGPADTRTLYVGIFGSGQIVTLAFPLLLGVVVSGLTRMLGAKLAYEAVFLSCSALFYTSVFLASRLREPRHG
ncbi:MFS transporter [Candidatus Poribacteria bacterium]|nr:MFS transporter [Candidatus Poribacteria bacterium]MBT5536699.1 MFS transporter [Candidatus Poribacteria bacterium]MBT5714874.1 MFS transporter [Candidatus Poribacteria bacterium]MBT7100400.1 MFS transporter [Candidatus Poribacteria bacterium]MBT7809379.1 MFS transporter [Candidatus Poribacteria bacterium]